MTLTSISNKEKTTSDQALQEELSFAAKDSQRFGLTIYRAKLQGLNAGEILQQILDNAIDTAIIRIPTTKLSEVQRLERLAMPNQITDTLAYYHLSLENHVPLELENNDLQFIVATPEHHPIINILVRETFGDYVNHYRINPFFDNEHVTEGYQDWVRSYAENDDTRLCWLVKLNDEFVGFISFNFEKEEKGKGILYGVKPMHRGKGIFRDMMKYAINYSNSIGRKYIRVTTQIENTTVQKVWTDLGFRLHHLENTIHINAMLKKSVFDRFEVTTSFECSDYETDKISNKHIIKIINKYLDFERNMNTRNHHFVNIKRLNPQENYRLQFSFPTGNRGLLRVFDKNEVTHMLVYFNLRHFIA